VIEGRIVGKRTRGRRMIQLIERLIRKEVLYRFEESS